MSLKSSIKAFGKFFGKSDIIVYNDKMDIVVVEVTTTVSGMVVVIVVVVVVVVVVIVAANGRYSGGANSGM